MSFIFIFYTYFMSSYIIVITYTIYNEFCFAVLSAQHCSCVR